MSAYPRIADRPRDSLIIVTCMYGGQAALAAQLLCEYGYANVKAPALRFSFQIGEEEEEAGSKDARLQVMQGGNEDARKCGCFP